MKEEIYQWMRSLAVFYILLTMILHLSPDGKYIRYIRVFMGLLLILMISSPVFAILGKGEEVAKDFHFFYTQESSRKEQEELASLQERYLQKGYQEEIQKKVVQALETIGIEAVQVQINRKGEQTSLVLYLPEKPDKEQERRIADGLKEAVGISQGEYEIRIRQDGSRTVGSASASGTSSGCDRPSGIGWQGRRNRASEGSGYRADTGKNRA